MTQDQTRQLGRALMALSAVQLGIFLIGALRRSYLVIAIPVGMALAAIAGLGFWVGYTMANTDFDDPADYPPVPQPTVPDTGAVPSAAEGIPTPQAPPSPPS
jgi:hypothetical protein